MIIKKIDDSNYLEIIDLTIKILKKQGLVVFPSDTVYGLLVDATDEKAVKKLIEFKNRPPGKAISVFVSNFSMIEDLVFLDERQRMILEKILPGPYTIVLKSKHKISTLLESEKKTLGIRFTNFRFINYLVDCFGKPITATSANLSNKSPHHSIKSLLKSLPKSKQKLIDLIVDGGYLPRNKPSTVVDLTEENVKILRKGDKDFNQVRKFISLSEEETKKIAKQIFKTIKNNEKNSDHYPLIFIIEGELGVGKTVFVKGIAEELGIKNIISPTYTIYYEYDIKISNIKYQISKLIHFDLYNIGDKEEFKYLSIEKLLRRGNILCFEWGEKTGEIYDLLKNKGKIIYIRMKYINEKKREIEVKN